MNNIANSLAAPNIFPQNLTQQNIVPRKMQFSLASHSTHNWCCNDIIYTALMNALSLVLPLGEDFFIQAVRQYDKDLTDVALKQDVKCFIAQEAIHSKQHQLYNQLLLRDGYDISAIEQATQQALDEAWQTSSPMERLAITIALEHLTHVFGAQALTYTERLKDWDADYRSFWLWHGAEEIEHKNVCFDVYHALGGGYFMRCKALTIMSVRMFDVFFKSQYILLTQLAHIQQIPMPSKRAIRAANFKFMFGAQGFLRGAEWAYVSWFRPNYHPSQHNSEQALTAWKQHTLPLNHVADVAMPL